MSKTFFEVTITATSCSKDTYDSHSISRVVRLDPGVYLTMDEEMTYMVAELHTPTRYDRTVME